MTINLLESATIEKKGSDWRICVINAGKGSSGEYPAETLQVFGPLAWPSGTQIFLDHLTESDDWERKGNHSIKDLAGVLTSTPEWDEEKQGLYADARIFETHAPFVSQAFEHIGLSVEAKGTIEDGKVVSIAPSRLNAIAIVPRAGAGGRFSDLIEQFIGEEETVTEEQIKALIEGITNAITPLIESLKPAPAPEPVEDEDKNEVDYAAVTESAIEAGLPKTGRARVIAAVREGATAEDAIASEKAVMEEYSALREAEGEVHVAGSAKVETIEDIIGGVL